jgi:aryl-alcohol dehydrogenase-like predicted oxidoreductase
MERRSFLRSALGPAVTRLALAKRTLPRRRYRDAVELSIIGFGGMVVVGQEQNVADRAVAEAIERGVNYFDVAPTYGDGEAETKLGKALVAHRKNVFLACKTTARDAPGSQKEFDQSLERLRTDHFDLYQFHAVSSLQDVEQILAPGGAAETFLKARRQGKVRYLGCSAHSAEAALALMDRFRLDSILFPLNFVIYEQGKFGPQILAKAKEKGVARLALKSLAYTKLPEGARKTYANCWYKPVDNRALAAKALRFTLSEDVTAAIPPGDLRLFQMAVDLASEFRPLSAAERQTLLASTAGVEPLFRA